MLTTYDVNAVKNFAHQLDERRSRCDCHVEGLSCFHVEEAMACHHQLATELLAEVKSWIDQVFRGTVEPNAEVEAIFKAEVETAVSKGRELVELADSEQTECYEYDHLQPLTGQVKRLERFLTFWTSPKLAVGPSARVRPSAQAASEIAANFASLKDAPSVDASS